MESCQNSGVCLCTFLYPNRNQNLDNPLAASTQKGRKLPEGGLWLGATETLNPNPIPKPYLESQLHIIIGNFPLISYYFGLK